MESLENTAVAAASFASVPCAAGNIRMLESLASTSSIFARLNFCCHDNDDDDDDDDDEVDIIHRARYWP